MGLSLSVVICTRNRADDLVACLCSIAAQRRLPTEVVVVDASDTDDPRRRVSDWAVTIPKVDVRIVSAAPGLTRQRNVAIEATTGDVVVFLDDDVVLEPGYLAAIAALFERESTLGGAEGVVRTEPLRGRRRLANALRAAFLMNSLGRPRGVKRSGNVAYDPWPCAPQPVSCLVGCNMAYRREVFDCFRFDEWYDGYGLGEDADFSFRVSRAFRLVQTPSARLTHNLSPVARDRLATRHEMARVNHYYFVRKNLPPGPLTWFAFLWSELGELVAVAKTADTAALAGILRGYRRILRMPPPVRTAAIGEALP